MQVSSERKKGISIPVKSDTDTALGIHERGSDADIFIVSMYLPTYLPPNERRSLSQSKVREARVSTPPTSNAPLNLLLGEPGAKKRRPNAVRISKRILRDVFREYSSFAYVSLVLSTPEKRP